jgi:hypothetical protein
MARGTRRDGISMLDRRKSLIGLNLAGIPPHKKRVFCF